MVNKGDGAKKIWATEWGYPTGGGASAVTEEQQADYLKRGLALFASYSWGGPVFFYKYHDDCADAGNYDCWHGLTRLDYTEKPAFTTYAQISSDAVEPTVAITSHATGTTLKVNTAVTLQANATDAVGLSNVAFYVNGTSVCVDASAPFTCVWTVPSKRGVQYTVEARAFDIAGNHASSSVKVTSN
jgi:hypothetical protein